MLVLIMTVCTMTAPDKCDEARLQFTADESIMQCMMQAPPYLAQWAGQHPNTVIKRWRCAYSDREQQGI